MNRPAVTVVIPTHNRADLMPATLSSVLAQRDVDLQVVVIDDGSSDATPDVLEAVDDPRLRWRVNALASGVANARNTGLAMVDTPWVAFADDDDLWAPRKLARQFESLRMDRQAKWSLVGSVVVDDSLRILRHEKPPNVANLADRVLKNNCVPAGGSGVLVSTALVRDVGAFDPQFSNLADWDLWIRLALAAPATSVPHPMVAYRVSDRGMAHAVCRTEDELAVITAKYEDERARRNVSVDRATWYRYLARLYLRRGDQHAAAQNYWRAARAGQWTRYGVVALSVTVPDLWTWADRRGRLRVPKRWASEADTWLDELRMDLSPSCESEDPE